MLEPYKIIPDSPYSEYILPQNPVSSQGKLKMNTKFFPLLGSLFLLSMQTNTLLLSAFTHEYVYKTKTICYIYLFF